MSITSTATISAVHDPTLCNDHYLANHICNLVATHGNGTLFSHDSFQEEDLVELCIGLGQAHPDGVLQISETKALLAFWCTTKMMAAMHPMGVAMELHDKPIRLCIHPPTNTHLRDYVAVREGCPSGTQTPTTGREVVSQSLPSKTHLEESPPTQFHMAFRDLGDAQLRQLMEDLWQGAAQRDLTVSPIGPPLGHCRAPTAGVDANLGDEKVTLQGEGMVTQQSTAHIPLLNRGGCWPPPQHTCSWIKVGNPEN